MKTKVSVIIPVYNVKLYLRQCLDSVLAQNLDGIEIVCVDDGSSDGSADILREYAAKHGNVSVVWQDNKGAGTARNEGIAVAKGEYAFFCDADDYLAPDLLGNLYSAADEADADLAFFTRTLWSESQGRIIKEYSLPADALAETSPFPAAKFKDNIISMFGPQPWNKLVKMDFIREKKLRYQEVPRMNDVLFSAVAVAMAERIVAVPVTGYFHRVEQAGEHLQSQGGNNRTPYIAFEVYEAIRDELMARGVFETFRRSFYKAAESTFAYSLRTVDEISLLEELFVRARRFMLRAADEDCADPKSCLIANTSLLEYLKDLSNSWPVKQDVLDALVGASAGRKKAVALICDDAYTNPCVVALTSLALSAANAGDYVIYVCVNGMSDENRSLIAALRSDPWKLDIRFVDLDMERYRSIYVHYEGNTGAGSITAFAKFDLPYLLPEDRVLYIDGDIIIRKDIAPLFEVELGGCVAAAVRDSGRLYNATGLRARLKCYFNSGVMMLNLKKMRLGDYRRKLIAAKISLNDPKLVDQDAFNIAFDGQVKPLSIAYNALMVNLHNNIGRFSMRWLNMFYKTNYSCMRALEEDLTILHFASKEKPWKYRDVRYADLWNEYYARSPLAEKELGRGWFHEGIAASVPSEVDVPVMMATDSGYLPYTYVAIRSALENHRAPGGLKFHIVMPKMPSEEERGPFGELAVAYPKSTIEFFEMGENAFSGVQMRIPHISRPTFYRLCAPSLFPQYDRMIYLDGDIVVEGDLRSLYDQDIGDNYVGGVLAAAYRWQESWFAGYCQRSDIPGTDQYINAGVLLMDLAAMRRDGLESEFLARADRGYGGQDQDVINGVCYGHIAKLNYTFNCQTSKYETMPERLNKVFTIKETTAADNWPEIIHYAAQCKPWQDFSLPLADRWWKYAKDTPYYSRFVADVMTTAIDGGVAARMRYLDIAEKLRVAQKKVGAPAPAASEVLALKATIADRDRELALLKCRRGIS